MIEDLTSNPASETCQLIPGQSLQNVLQLIEHGGIVGDFITM